MKQRREYYVRLALEEAILRGYPPGGVIAIDIGNGWMTVTHVCAEWLVPL